MIHTHDLITHGSPESGTKAIILIHGRGGTPEDIMSLVGHFDSGQVWALAPRAPGNSWYPYSFLAPVQRNQPHLDLALSAVDGAISVALNAGFTHNQIYLTGFSQGACLTLEYAARHAVRYGGVIAFTGGLIGASLHTGNYQGDFAGTPIHISAGSEDPHVPLSRIKESVAILQKLNGQIHTEIYPDKPHSISMEEIASANKHVFGMDV